MTLVTTLTAIAVAFIISVLLGIRHHPRFKENEVRAKYT